MRDPRHEFMRFHYGDDAVQTDLSEFTDIQIIRNDIERIDKKLTDIKSELEELVSVLQKLNTL
tara:strand:+ start:11656 stop:11844 length:189 start_codon:yes stop_codon:yes gene_type:complete